MADTDTLPPPDGHLYVPDGGDRMRTVGMGYSTATVRRLLAERDERIARLTARVAALEAENAALRADAERYRWLRERTGRSSAGTHNHAPAAFMVMPAWRVPEVGMSLDAAIDAARTPEARDADPT